MNNKDKKPSLLKVIAIYLLVFLVIAGIISAISGGSIFGGGDVKEIEFSQLVDYFEKNQVSEVTVNESSRSYIAKLKTGKSVSAYAPTSYDMYIISEKYIAPQSSPPSAMVMGVAPGWSLRMTGVAKPSPAVHCGSSKTK